MAAILTRLVLLNDQAGSSDHLMSNPHNFPNIKSPLWGPAFPSRDTAKVKLLEKWTGPDQPRDIIPRFLRPDFAICLSQLTIGKLPLGTFG